MLRLTRNAVLLLVLLIMFVLGLSRVEQVRRGGDTDGDGDTNGDGVDGGDADADATGDADSDGKGDADADGDTDADGKGGTYADGDGGIYRPKYGVVDGQGCTGHAGCKGTTRQPYFIWTRFHTSSNNRERVGGMVYFEWRGRDGVFFAMLPVWAILGIILMIAGLVLRDEHQPPLCPPPSPGSPLFYLDLYSPVPLRGSWAELTVSMWIVVWLVLCFLYVWNHADINNLVGKVPRGIGGMVAGMLTIQVFPVARRSVLLWTFGIPFERALKFHKKLGLWIWLLMTGHGVGMWAAHFDYYDYGEPVKVNGVWQYKQGLPTGEAMGKAFERLVEWDIGFPHGPPLAGLLCWVVTCLMVVSAAFFRRKHWNTFVVLHTGYALIYPLAWIHYPSLMIFSAIPVLLYLVDFFWGYYEGYGEEGRVVEVGRFDHGTWITVEVPKKGYHAERFLYAGKWASLKLPEVAVNEWHPFSVVPVPPVKGEPADYIRFRVHVKRCGDWTERVWKGGEGLTRAVALGPYGGKTFDIRSKDPVYLIAGGVGITAVLGYLTSVHAREVRQQFVPDQATIPLAGNKPFVLVWVFRGASAFKPFADDIRRIAKDETVDMHLYDTGPQHPHPLLADKPSFQAEQFVPGRPDFHEVLDLAPSTAGVFACGPGSFMRDVEEAAMRKKLAIHREAFEL